MREASYQLRFRVGMLASMLYVALMLMLFSGAPLLLSVSVPSPISIPPLMAVQMAVQRYGFGWPTVPALVAALANLLVAATAHRRIQGLDMCTSGFLARQMSVVLVAAQFDRRQPEWPSPSTADQVAPGRALLLFLPGLVILQLAVVLLAVPCLAMWAWVFITGIVPQWWVRVMTRVVRWMDRIAYQVLMGATREATPLDLQPPRHLRRSPRTLPGAVVAGDSDESLETGPATAGMPAG